MKVAIKKESKKYILAFDNITQLCGTNIGLKTFLIDSICKHFSSEKYKEYEESLIENIEIDGEVPGRKQWECYRISSKEDIISAIQMSKGSILGKCLKEYVGSFDCQNELFQIDELLMSIFEKLNASLLLDDVIEFQYAREDLFNMIQQTSVRTKDDKDIHELDNSELLDIFFRIIAKQQELVPEKRMYIFENIDHLLSWKDYRELVHKCEALCRESNLWFIFTTSIDKYVAVSDALIEAINVINEEIYSLPSAEHIMSFIRDYYPLEAKWNEEMLFSKLEVIIHKIGLNSELIQPSELILMKIINESNYIKTKWLEVPKMPEIQCLLDENVV